MGSSLIGGWRELRPEPVNAVDVRGSPPAPSIPVFAWKNLDADSGAATLIDDSTPHTQFNEVGP
jgi:beta-phosphoglucomutase-like phosphatase (HAD superfamily)